MSALGGLSTAGTCNVSCAGGNACGGKVGVGISALLQDPQPLPSTITISSPNATFIKLFSTVGVTVNSSGRFYTDWGDGAISLLGFQQHVYDMAGRFNITARLHDTDAVSATSKEVVVVDAIMPFSMQCPAALEVGVATGCNVTLLQGYNYTFSATIKSPYQEQTFAGTVPDAVMDMYGWTVHPQNSTGYTNLTYNGKDIVLLRNSLAVQ
ncbi:uncharacterized protein LOC125179370 [Hyalella azteca]|uniref:Uncharacterized protein LOC125179370 n=1 Tax=Hyalella azteca TaxID=294128 RepID=A0A979FX92_HYAAZ|nr:uncharacterized protein LOC125179370 [Hyalella azteca]